MAFIGLNDRPASLCVPGRKYMILAPCIYRGTLYVSFQGDDKPLSALPHIRTKKSNTSWSLQNKGCGASQMRPGSNVRRATSLPCGAKARKQGKDVPCKGKSK